VTAAIAGWTLTPVGGRFSREVKSARGQWTRREGAILRLRDDDGREGFGEVAPLPGFSRESLDACTAALREVAAELVARGATVEESLVQLAGALPAPGEAAVDPGAGDHGRSPHGPPPCAGTDGFLPRTGPAAAGWAARLSGLPAARFALETALLDLAARRANVSISGRLAGNTARSSLPRSGLLAGPGDLDGARRLLAAGLRTLKVKVGIRPFPEELASLRRLREELGPEVALRLDAGGAWTVDEAREQLAALAAEVAPELCEEPTSGEGLLALGETAVPWAADESLAIPGLAPRLLAAPGLAAVVLKPALLGGFEPSLALARAAMNRGVASLVTHLFDGPVGLAAACELALALPGPVLPCGLDPHPGLDAWPPVSVPQLREPDRVVASGRPGLGIEDFPC
jgi:o-succinylbenzoate synthase